MSPGLALYLEQSVSLGGLSLALLYINMLSFGQLMTAYLVWRGMRIDVIGVWRGISAVIGLFGTTAFSFSVSRISLEATGLWSIAFQFTCLTLSYASLFVHDYNTSLGMLIVGVCASRIGLWVFDISITQIMQIGVPEKFRGVVGGVQHALNAFCALLAFGIGILYPDPSQFFILVGVGYLGVGTAMILYACWFYKLSDSGVVWV